MSSKNRAKEAAVQLRASGFEPLEDYPGNNRTPWRCRHLQCGNEVTLKMGSISSGKNPCRWCNGQWVNPDEAAMTMRNVGLEPIEPYVSSKHGWLCRCMKCGRESTVRYNSVATSGTGCRFCGKERAADKRRFTKETAASMMLSAGYQPCEPYRNANSKWLCIHLECGREVVTTLSQIRGGNGACKHCAGLIVEPHVANDVMRAAGYEPLEPYVNSGHKWRCRCLKCGKETTPTYSQAKAGNRCRYCARKAIKPEDAIELMRNRGFEPLEDYPGSMTPWMCRHMACGTVVSPRYAHVQQGRRACKVCSTELNAEQFRLNDDDAAFTMREAGLIPLESYPGNNKPWKCRHEACGEIVRPTRASITQGQGGCRKCGQKRLAELFRTPEKDAIAAMKGAGFEPAEPYPGKNHVPWKSLCAVCKREVAPSLSNVKNGATCIYCAGYRLDASDVHSFMIRAGLEPLEPYPGNNHGDWRCRHVSCQREVVTRYSLVRDGNSGCVYCNGGRIHPDDAAELMRLAGLEPLEPFPGTSTRWKCTHLACGRVVNPTYSNVANGGGGCRSCSDSSFNYTAPGVVYLLRHDSFFTTKIGITTTAARTSRIREHERGGWTLVKKWMTPTGLDAELVEAAILNWWRTELGAPIALTRENMPSGGHTETAPLVNVDLSETVQRVEHYLALLCADTPVE